jgi:hypothetical protein
MWALEYVAGGTGMRSPRQIFRDTSWRLAILSFTAMSLLTPRSVYATAIASSEISFSNLEIVSETGTVVFVGAWSAEAFGQTSNSRGELASQFDSSIGGTATANVTANFANTTGTASASQLAATATSKVDLPGSQPAQALSVGSGTLFNSFMKLYVCWINFPSGSVMVSNCRTKRRASIARDDGWYQAVIDMIHARPPARRWSVGTWTWEAARAVRI